MPSLREWVIELVVMIGVGVGLAALGPFGSFELGSFGARLAYWLPATAIGYAIFRPITLASVLIAQRLALPEIPAALVGTLVAAAPGTLAIAYLGDFGPGPPQNFDGLFQLYIQVAMIGVLVMLLFVLLGKGPAKPASELVAAASTEATPGEPALPSPFLDRLPPAWRDRLVALEMEDHYVRAHGPDASTLILQRMRDAEAELAASSTACVFTAAGGSRAGRSNKCCATAAITVFAWSAASKRRSRASVSPRCAMPAGSTSSSFLRARPAAAWRWTCPPRPSICPS